MLRHVSLFAGGGGFDIGFSSAGFRCELAIDVSTIALRNLAANLCAPTRAADLSGRLGDIPSADAFVAGPPCQGFSTLGTRDLGDPRNRLLLVPAIAASMHRPRIVVIENVPGARARRHAHHMQVSAEILRSAGYRVMDLQIDMSTLGVPQRRLRAFQIAWLGARDLRIPKPRAAKATLGDVLVNIPSGAENHLTRLPPRDSRDAIVAAAVRPGERVSNVRNGRGCVRTWDIPGAFGPPVTAFEREVLEVMVRERRRNRTRNWGDADPLEARRVSAVLGAPAGNALRTLVRKGYVRRLETRYDLAQTFNGKYRRPMITGLAPVVDSRFTEAASVLHPVHNRAMTVREAARVQGFPDGYVLTGTRRQQTLVLANAVPPPAGAYIAQAIGGFLRC